MKHPFILTVAVMALTALLSCSKQEEEGLVRASFSISTVPFTRASADGDGAAASVNRFIMEVYREDNGAFYDRVEKTVPSGTVKTTMDVSLVVGQTYSFVFWADCSKDGEDLYYDTHSAVDHGLTEVRMTGSYKGNDDGRDAFFASVTDVAHHAFSNEILLTRPFAQVNVITDDLESVSLGRLQPSGVAVSVEAFTSFNALKGETTGTRSVLEYSAAPYYLGGGSGANSENPSWTLSMDYLFASPEKEVLTRMAFTTEAGGRKVSRTFDNVPYRRNYRTNVYGSLLTAGGTYKVLIAPDFNTPDINL